MAQRMLQITIRFIVSYPKREGCVRKACNVGSSRSGLERSTGIQSGGDESELESQGKLHRPRSALLVQSRETP